MYDFGTSTPSLDLVPQVALTDQEYDIGYLTDPVTKAPAGPSSNIASTLMLSSMAMSAFGSIATGIGQSRAAKAQGDYEASIANTNAAISKLQAKETLESGDAEAARQNLKTGQAVGAERAAQGASGTDVSTGSNVLTRIGTQEVGAMDELTIRNNAQRQAWGLETAAIQDTYKGQYAKLTSDSEAHQSLVTGGLKAIEGPTAIYTNYLRFQRWMPGGSGGTAGVPFPVDQ